MANGCCTSDSNETLIFACAGAAHSGQVSSRAGIGLAKEGAGNLFCIAAMGAEIPDKMNRAHIAGKRVVIDGCEDHCARKIMEKASLPVEVHVDVTRFGIEKKPEKPQLINDARCVVDEVWTLLTAAS